MSIHLEAGTAGEIRRHAERAYPHECCGALLGKVTEKGRQITRALRITNARAESADNRFLVTDADYLRAEKEALLAGLELLGFYHSHPDHAARPSRFDLEHAFPWFSYVILAVSGGRAGELTSWILAEDRARFHEEEAREHRSANSPRIEGAG